MISRILAATALVLLVLTGTETAFSNSLVVPTEYPTIKAALSVAAPGDSVLINPGRYLEHNLIMVSGVNLMGTGTTPNQVEINAQGQGRVLLCETIANGTISNITFSEGHAAGEFSYDQSGGGIFCSYSDIDITNCIFTDNHADAHGGAIRFSHGTSEIVNCRFIGNTATSGGGGAIDCSYDSSPRIIESYFRDNQAAWGGALSCRGDAAPMVISSSFHDNLAVGPKAYGGGIFADRRSRPQFVQCTLSGNEAKFGGALACFENSATNLNHCTVSNNLVLWRGAGMFCFDASPTITNTLICNQFGAAITTQGLSEPRISRTNIFGNSDGDWSDTIAAQLYNRSNFSADPMFCSEAPDESFDYSLQENSPCAPDNNNGDYIGAWTADCSFTTSLISAFTSTWQGTDVQLLWQTSSVDNDIQFKVTRSEELAHGEEMEIPHHVISAGNYEAVDTNLEPEAGTVYKYRLYYLAPTEQWQLMEEKSLTAPEIPAAVQTLNAWPNPFNPSTTISFGLNKPQHVKVSIYTIDGRLINTLCDEPKSAGKVEIPWPGTNQAGQRVGSGIYLVLVQNDTDVQTQKITLLK